MPTDALSRPFVLLSSTASIFYLSQLLSSGNVYVKIGIIPSLDYNSSHRIIVLI